MTSCVSCGADVTGKKFCPHCGTRVQATGAPVSNQSAPVNACPRCNGEVAPGAAFCVHCGAALGVAPAMRICPACQTEVPSSSAFCTNCGHDMRGGSVSQPAQAPAFCTSCGQQNAPGVRFCGHCGSPMGVGAAQTVSMQSGQYPPPPPPYQQYPQQYGQSQYAQQYVQPGSYQAQPMMGQGPMVLRCPTCMAMAPLGTPNCLSCHTSLAGIVPTPASMPAAGQQGGLGGFLQGSGGQMAMGALGGAAAVIGGEMLLHGIENSIENRVEGDMGYGYRRHHHRDEGLLGDLGDLANDIGL